nr:thioredoxin domain-containing protein [uncultured Flavobacterium sp.]
MTNNYNFLFQYLEKEQITIDKNEFEFQIQSHPDYPSLLAVADTLSFFNIDNIAIQVGISEIELLPDHFICLLDKESAETGFYFIERKDEIYTYTKDRKTVNITKSDLESRWNNIVLLIEKAEIEYTKQIKINNWYWVLPALCIISFISTILRFNINISTILFFIFPSAGMLLSVAALKDLFGTQNSLINSFCNMTSSTSCNSIIDSKKWKIFQFVNFSDLSIVFFTSQFLALMIFLFAKDIVGFFSIQKAMLIGASPILFLSIYYQKFVEKKWCPICLAIIAVIFLELFYVLFFQETTFKILLHSLIVMGFVFASVILVWSILKKLLNQQKELKEFQFKAKRFMRNYEIFKNTLLASEPIENYPIQSGSIILGNAEASLKILMVTSPFCGYCKDAHTMIEEIIQKYYDTVCFDIRFNFNNEYSDDTSKKIHQQLVAIYFEQGQEAFMKALKHWFEYKSEKELSSLFIDKEIEFKINMLLEEQFKWNQKNNLSYTPAIIINQFVFPKQYERNELIHFINELSEDQDF